MPQLTNWDFIYCCIVQCQPELMFMHKMCRFYWDNKQKLWVVLRGITLKNYLIRTQIKFDLHTLMMNLYIEFQIKMSMHDWHNERKTWINRNFLSPRGITLTGTKFKLDRCILMMNLHTEFQSKMSIHNWDNERKPWINRNFRRPRGITYYYLIGPKLFDWNQIRPRPAYTHDEPTYWISIQNVITRPR